MQAMASRTAGSLTEGQLPMDWYNGYSPQERNKKLRELHKRFPNRSHPHDSGPCHMCGDPNSPVAPHSENYSEPFLWDQPAEYALCKTCHGRLHKRFKSPLAWEAYKLHLRRGGYGSDLKSPPVARLVARLAKAMEAGDAFPLETLRPSPSADIWCEKLTTATESLTAAWARKR
jgi:hypothetical protein